MDGYQKKKTNLWRGKAYSDTRFAVIKWLEKELPTLQGRVVNIAAGGWEVPRLLLDFNRVKDYITTDQKFYGDSKNNVAVIADVHSLPFQDAEFDAALCNQALECFENPFKALQEIHRILKPGGVLLIDTPFNYSAFGRGTTPESLQKKNPVKDYWRITPQGLELLLKPFSRVSITTSGPNKWDPYCVMGKAIK